MKKAALALATRAAPEHKQSTLQRRDSIRREYDWQVELRVEDVVAMCLPRVRSRQEPRTAPIGMNIAENTNSYYRCNRP